MRFLLSFAGGFGHAAPLFPIGKALIERGHDVLFTGQQSALPAVAAAGFKVIDSGGTLVVQPSAHSRFQPFDENSLRERMRGNFGDRIARERFVGVGRVVKDWHPDALICDEVDFGAMLAAESLTVPHINVLVIASGRIVTPAWFAASIDRIRADYGLRPDPNMRMIATSLTLSPFPAELRHPSAIRHNETLYFRDNWQTSGQHSLDTPPDQRRPRIYATFGTDFNKLAVGLFQTLLKGLSILGADVVATVGRDCDPQDFGPQPFNIDLRRFVDQAELLGSCNLMVCHGGSGSLLGGLAHGLPMLILPLGADQPFNAERGAELGFALTIEPRTADATSIASAASQALCLATYRSAAELLQARIRCFPPVESLITCIEDKTSQA
jgi:UDP:flavonoid glycosyltransferase YjiC (YdhE family)